jgi:hypothetical protein
LYALESRINGQQASRYMFVDGKSQVPPRLDLGEVILAFVQGVTGDFCATDASAMLRIDLCQQSLSLYNQAVFVNLSGGGIHIASCVFENPYVAADECKRY